jgi:ferredoxin, 2Fe-2S
MPKIIFIAQNGEENAVHAEVGDSVMKAAMNSMVPGLIADCGGNCSCATCHAYVDTPWLEKLPAPSDDEKAMLECALHVEPSSRLTCQVFMTPELDGMVIRTPVSQM